ncbi:MAG: hypothetical protein FJ257_02160 [Phycisphaerae bacterium]|nr:hypothetical protein [Phycisphaerae bacterium]
MPPSTRQVTTIAFPALVEVTSLTVEAPPLPGFIAARSPARSTAPRKLIACIHGPISGSSFAASRESSAAITPFTSEVPSASIPA